MSDIKIVRPHRLTLEQARAAAQQTADDLAATYDLESRWEGHTLHFRRSGVEGRMEVSERQIALDLKLGFLLRPFKARFEEHIERHFVQLLEGASTPSAPQPAGGEGMRPAPQRTPARASARPAPAAKGKAGGRRK